jgi:hypothetical protein
LTPNLRDIDGTLDTGDNRVEYWKTETGNSRLQTLESGVEQSTESSSLGDVDRSLQAINGRD